MPRESERIRGKNEIERMKEMGLLPDLDALLAMTSAPACSCGAESPFHGMNCVITRWHLVKAMEWQAESRRMDEAPQRIKCLRGEHEPELSKRQILSFHSEEYMPAARYGNICRHCRCLYVEK